VRPFFVMAYTLIRAGVTFGQTVIGIIFRPYETYRRIAMYGKLLELMYIVVLLALYFATAALVKTSLFTPFLLTRKFLVLTGAAAYTFIIAVSLFWFLGKLFGSSGTLRTIALGWAYSLVPTWGWFFLTSILYVILPPQRTTRTGGMIFSFVYLLISTVLFLWKIILSFLTLRFGLKLDFIRILAICTIALPILALYSLGMYRLGIFRIPFI